MKELHKSVKAADELTEQLAYQIHRKNQGIKLLVWGGHLRDFKFSAGRFV